MQGSLDAALLLTPHTVDTDKPILPSWTPFAAQRHRGAGLVVQQALLFEDELLL